MSIWGNISHFVGDIFGGDDDEKKKKQQQQQKQQQNRSTSVSRPSTPAPGSVVLPTRPQDSPIKPVEQPDNSIKLPLTQKPQQAPQAGSFDPSQKLVKAVSKPTAPDTRSVKQHAIDVARDTGSAAAGTALGATRVVGGVVEGTLEIPRMAAHLGKWMGETYTGEKNVNNPLVNAIDKGTDWVEQPLKKFNKTVDKAAQGYGGASQKVYKPAQVVGNVATIAPAVAAGGAALLSKANKGEAIVPALQKFATQDKSPIISNAFSAIKRHIPGVRSVNPNQEADAAAAAQHELQPQIDQTIADGKAGDTQRLLSDLRADDPLTTNVRTPEAVMPEGGENFVAPHQVLAAQERASGAEAAAIDRTPAYQRRAAQDDATLAADQAAAQNADLIDTPAFERRGIELPSETPTVTDINDGLRNNAITIAQDPQVAPLIAQSFQATGAKNPLSLVMHTLSNTTDKNVIRNLVHRLVPDADPNTLNRAVNSITGADDVTDVSHALSEAAARKPAVLGPVSDAPAPAPAPVAAPEAQAPSVAPERPVATPAAVTPVDATSSVPAAAAPTPHVASEPVVAPEMPVAPAKATNPGTEAPTIPETTPLTSGEQVPVAPRFREATMKQLGDLAKGLPGDGQMRDVTNLDDLANAAKGVVEKMSPEELLDVFGAGSLDELGGGAKGFAIMRAARDKLSEMLRADPANTDIRDALVNTMNEMEQRASGNGLLQRVIQEDFDNMPIEAKVRYLVRRIDKANAETKNYVTIASDPARQAEVDAVLTARLQASQDVADKISAIEAKLNEAADAATKGQAVETKALTKEIRSLRAELQVKNGEAVKYFQELVPGRTRAQKILTDFPKRAMLSSFSGRFNDLLTTGVNVADHQAGNVIQGVVGGAVNLVKGKGTVSNTFKGGSRVIRGVGTGLKKFAGEIKGDNYVDDMLSATKGNKDLRSGLRKANGPISRTIQATTELATNVSEGVRSQRVYQLADQEAAKLGLKGKMRKQYAEARAETPSATMTHHADEVHKQLNNLNHNVISDTLNKVGEAIEGKDKTGIGGLIKNQIIPFTSWLGGNIWNTVTDKNVIAATIKFTDKALIHRDPEAAVHHLSQAIKGGAEAYGVGYLLAKNGYLTDKNAEGYNDAGMYIHVGNRYIPVGVLGFIAPNIVLGKMAHDGLNAGEGESAIAKMAGDIGNFAWHGLAVAQALGTDNNIGRAVDAGTQKGHDALDGLYTGAAGAIGQFIPALTGDINSLLDNGIPGIKGSDKLNPTHEAADTRVKSDKLTKAGKPSEAKDVKKSAVNSLIARIPVAAQQLPRKAGTAAKDFADRVVKGDHENGDQIKVKEDAKKEVDHVEDFKKRDIPNYKDAGFQDAVQARVERGEYDKVIEGLSAKADAETADKNIPAHKVEETRHQITQLRVAKNAKLSYDDMKKYNATSLTEWRNMGDSEDDAYDPDTYKKLWEIDKALDDAGVAGGFIIGDSHPTLTDKQKFSAKKDTSGSGSGKKSAATKAADAELNRIQSNTLGDVPKLAKLDLGDLRPQKAATAEIPKIQQIKSSELIKKRKITVSKA